MRKFTYIVLIFLAGYIPFKADATHIMGGEITWECQGGGAYVFDLVLYRDCNGFDVSTTTETIKVWNHSTISSIAVNFLTRIDISPTCTQVGGGPGPFLCGTGTGGGNGAGAVEKVIYRSNPVVLLGNPPAQGWIFTYSSFSRSANLTNIVNPTTVGITIVGKMFSTNANGTCNDSSPQFLEAPFVVSCAGQPYFFNPNAFDPDLDSMAFSFGMPYDQISSSFNPPSDPALITFDAGFSYTDPTPDASFSGGNIPAAINPQNGELTFTSFTSGNFAVKMIVQSFRNGNLVSEVQREMQVIVENCPVANSSPTVTPPFNGATSFDTTIYAGDLLNYTIIGNDNGLLQDGTAQSVILTASGAQFGTNFTNPASGCAIAPCAVLNTTPPITSSPTAQTNFSWQTACAHLVNSQGVMESEIPYTFVFKLQDDLCQIPGVRYATVTVHVKNKGVVPPTQIDCIQVQANGDVQLQYDQVTDVDNGFVSYSINAIPGGHLADEPSISTVNYTHVGANANAAPVKYVIGVKSGCGGGVVNYSDTVSSIFLILNNPGDGTAILQWNNPSPNHQSNWSNYYYIEREYPAGTWNVIDSVPYGTVFYKDTIDICSAFLNYRIALKTTTCTFYSNIEGDQFEDKIPPYIPIIQSVSIDTTTGDVTITWQQDPSPDTYGYIIYNQDNGGFFVNLDTVWGIGNTSYTYNPGSGGPFQYSVAAFDSCFTTQVPPSYQTSAKASIHKTMLLTGSLNICDKQVTLNWNDYVGWPSISNYEVYGYPKGGSYSIMATENSPQAVVDVSSGTTYCFVIKANAPDGSYSFSNKIFIYISAPTPPKINYLAAASVEDNEIEIRHHTDISPGNGGLILKRWNEDSLNFEEIERRNVSVPIEIFHDANADPNLQSYTYKVVVLDSCGNPSIESNIGKTIFLEVYANSTTLKNTLQWSAYEDWLGPVVEYKIYREVDGYMDTNPLATVTPERRSYIDDVSDLLNTTGKFCYVVTAIEGTDSLAISEHSNSNRACAVIEPLVYIPNAFTVGGNNPIFTPVISLSDFNNYDFTIFNRWGEVIYKTNKVGEGWNGVAPDGKYAEEGTYVYVVRLHDGNGNEITKRGHVTLLRDN